MRSPRDTCILQMKLWNVVASQGSLINLLLQSWVGARRCYYSKNKPRQCWLFEEENQYFTQVLFLSEMDNEKKKGKFFFSSQAFSALVPTPLMAPVQQHVVLGAALNMCVCLSRN